MYKKKNTIEEELKPVKIIKCILAIYIKLLLWLNGNIKYYKCIESVDCKKIKW